MKLKSGRKRQAEIVVDREGFFWDIKREIKTEIEARVAPLRDAVLFLNSILPVCDLTKDDSDIEISDSDAENQDQADIHADDSTENVEHSDENREVIAPQIGSVETREDADSDSFSGSIQFVTDPVISPCS